MIHHLRQSAIMRDWLDGYKVRYIASRRDVSEYEAVAVLLLEGVSWRQIVGREKPSDKRRYPRQRVLRLAALMRNGRCTAGIKSA